MLLEEKKMILRSVQNREWLVLGERDTVVPLHFTIAGCNAPVARQLAVWPVGEAARKLVCNKLHNERRIKIPTN